MSTILNYVTYIFYEPTKHFINLYDNAYSTISNLEYNIFNVNLDTLINSSLNNTYDNIIYDNITYYDITYNDILHIILKTFVFICISLLITIFIQLKRDSNYINKINNANELLELYEKPNSVNSDKSDKSHNLYNIKNQLYLHSINEISNKNDNIVSKLTANHNYIVFLRIKMKNDLLMKTTKYELNTINNINVNNNKNFITKHMYMLFNFNYNKQVRIDNLIVMLINYFNQITNEDYKNEDFIVLSIGKINDSNELYNGFNNINYELFNMKNITYKLDDNRNLKYILTLPVNDVYNMILDSFNETIFESNLYSINNNNYETWDGVPLF
jgi:hypothetical protein